MTDPAKTLEDAADLLLIRGRARDQAYGPNGELCVMAAISEAARVWTPIQDPAWIALKEVVAEPVIWNAETDDDFEVIDTLRHLAKDLRNAAVPA